MVDRQVIVYSSPTWSSCKAAKEFLSSKGVTFQDVNLLDHPEAADELVRLTGARAVPVIVVNGEPIVGFDRGKLQQLLGL